VKTVDDVMGEKNSSSGRKPLEKQCMSASSHTSLRCFLLRPFFVITTGSGNAMCPSTVARPCFTEMSDSVVLTTVVVKLISSPAIPEPTLSNPARELTSIPAWFNLWIAFPVTGSRRLEDTAPERLSSPHTNALVVSALNVGTSSWANAVSVNAKTVIVTVSLARISIVLANAELLLFQIAAEGPSIHLRYLEMYAASSPPPARAAMSHTVPTTMAAAMVADDLVSSLFCTSAASAR